jgi:predicted RNA-binding Zn-ribbon protein involved in translation (DUF1610 family)
MLAQESGLLDEVIVERGYRSIDGVSCYTELKALGFSKQQATPSRGLLLPLHTTDGQQPLMIYRPDQPQPDTNGRLRKYLLPKGASVRLDCPPRCQPLLADPGIPLWLTEGQKKADALASHGAVALCLLGVWNFKGKNPLGGTTFLADFDYVAWHGREVRLVFDSDIVTLPSVRMAVERLTEHLSRKGAAVRMVYLPPMAGKKVGVDDYLVAGHTLQDLEALIEAPRPQAQPAPPQVELLDAAPTTIKRPLTCIDGRTYAAIWPYIQTVHTESLDKQGNVVKLETPHVTREQHLHIVRDDGVIFGPSGDKPLTELGLDVHLPEIPPPAKLWMVPSVKAYVAGARPDPVSVFRDVASVIGTFIDFDRSLADQQTMCELVACYVLSTWFLDAFNVIGYLWPNGEKGSGKTQLLTIVAELAYLGQVILAAGSLASLRDLADYGATLAFDDAENVMDLKRGDPEKRTLLLAGNRRGNTIPVKEPVNGRAWRTRYVHTFCPRLFSAIRLPDPVLASRTIIVPLIRTADPQKANADPLEYERWSVPRDQLVNNLWALALRYGAKLPAYNARVGQIATLLGRNLEPWRAILAVAHWLTDNRVHDLSSRMEALAHAYQKERRDLEEHDLMPLVIQALCDYAVHPTPINPVNPMNPINMGSPDDTEIQFSTADITAIVKTLAQAQETGPDPETINAKRVGRVFGKMRLQEVPRPSGKAQPGAPKPSRARIWRATKGILRQWLVAYHLEIPDEFKNISQPSSPSNGVHGVNGVNGGCGIVAQPGSPNGATHDETCPQCGETQAPQPEILPDDSTVFRCVQCGWVVSTVPF